jgi:hypothetical protein
MTHVAAAALIVDDHEVDVNDLREDLKIENREYVVPAKHSSLQQLTFPQDQAVLLRARLQSQPPNTDRHDQVQVDQGRGREPQHRKAAHPAVVPEGQHPYQEEEINGKQDNHHKLKHRSSTELHDFILHFTSVTIAMWSSGTIGVGLDRPLHAIIRSPPHAPIPKRPTPVLVQRTQIHASHLATSRYHHRNPQLVIQKMPIPHKFILTSSPITPSLRDAPEPQSPFNKGRVYKNDSSAALYNSQFYKRQFTFHTHTHIPTISCYRLID